jgi:predicted GIY-YIG superfamily endonuclease
MWFVYLLCDGSSKTYVGMTNDIMKRYRTHKLHLSACAKYTKSWTDCILLAYFSEIPDKRTALSLEWHCKRSRSKRRSKVMGFIRGVMHDKFKMLRLNVYVREHEMIRDVQKVLDTG